MTEIAALMPLLLGWPTEQATSAKQLQIERIPLRHALQLNKAWHSQLPDLYEAALAFGTIRFALAATFDGGIYGVAIWTRPVAANRMQWPAEHLLELRRLAIPGYAPKYTASRMLGRMARWIKKDMPEVCRLVSYQMTSVHTGTIYAAANWTAGNTQTEFVSWENHIGTGESGQHKRGAPPTDTSPKVRWELALHKCGCANKRGAPTTPPPHPQTPPPSPPKPTPQTYGHASKKP